MTKVFCWYLEPEILCISRGFEVVKDCDRTVSWIYRFCLLKGERDSIIYLLKPNTASFIDSK